MDASCHPCLEINENTIQYNTIQYNTIQYNTIQYNVIQYNTIQSNTITNSLVSANHPSEIVLKLFPIITTISKNVFNKIIHFIRPE